jgi:hypothetical protein
MKNAVFWDVTPCGSWYNQHFGGTYRLHYQGDKNRRAGNNEQSNRNTEARCEEILLYLSPKRQSSQELQGVKSQKTTFFNYRVR